MHGEAQDKTIHLEGEYLGGEKLGTSVIEAHEVDVIGIHGSS
jgi:hypothetical protein